MVVGDFPIETDTLVIGAGPGGYVASIRASAWTKSNNRRKRQSWRRMSECRMYPFKSAYQCRPPL